MGKGARMDVVRQIKRLVEVGRWWSCEPGRYWRKYKEVDRSGKSIELDNCILWDVEEGNINLIFRVLACAKLDGQW